MKEFEFVTLYNAMCAFDNSPASCKALSAACAKVNYDYGKLRTDLLAFDCHGDRPKFLEKVNRKFRSICKAFNVEVEM